MAKAPVTPGQGAFFTPDPTVNGPWTHTRADIALFKPGAGAPAPTAAGSRPPRGAGGGGGGGGGGNGMSRGDMVRQAFADWRKNNPNGSKSVFAPWSILDGPSGAVGGGRGGGSNPPPPDSPAPPPADPPADPNAPPAPTAPQRIRRSTPLAAPSAVRNPAPLYYTQNVQYQPGHSGLRDRIADAIARGDYRFR